LRSCGRGGAWRTRGRGGGRTNDSSPRAGVLRADVSSFTGFKMVGMGTSFEGAVPGLWLSEEEEMRSLKDGLVAGMGSKMVRKSQFEKYLEAYHRILHIY
jgi:hypothetical protein